MSKYPHGPPPPYYGGWPPPPPPHDGYPPHLQPPPPDGGHMTVPPGPYPYYVPGAVMFPVPMAPMPMPMPVPPPSEPPSNPTYITNYIYHGETSNQPQQPAIEGMPLEFGECNWVPTTATTAACLTGQAVVGGREGWDGSPLWVIRAWHNDNLIPGKFSIRHNTASVSYNMKEVPVQNIEVLIAKPDSLRWIPATNGNVPPGALPGGKTVSGETLYIGRAKYQLSITPGKVQPSNNCCYIPFAGSEVAQTMYDVLCKI